MPIYEYKCGKCNKKFEVFQGVADKEVGACKFCGGPVNKLISLSSFHLKGSGWYVTDYGGKKLSTQDAHLPSEDKNNSPSSTGETAVVPDSKPSSEKSE